MIGQAVFNKFPKKSDCHFIYAIIHTCFTEAYVMVQDGQTPKIKKSIQKECFNKYL